jgi:hypothetical protein
MNRRRAGDKRGSAVRRETGGNMRDVCAVLILQARSQGHRGQLLAPAIVKATYRRIDGNVDE